MIGHPNRDYNFINRYIFCNQCVLVSLNKTLTEWGPEKSGIQSVMKFVFCYLVLNSKQCSALNIKI